VGDFDYSKEVVAALGGKLWFEQVRIKPGKPVLLFTLGERVVFCLPGNPVSAFVTFELFVRPLLERWCGASRCWPVPDAVVLAERRAPPRAHRSPRRPSATCSSSRACAPSRPTPPAARRRAGALERLGRPRRDRARQRADPRAAADERGGGDGRARRPLVNAWDDLPRAREPVA
jgi:molybdopterin molybdotransferase